MYFSLYERELFIFSPLQRSFTYIRRRKDFSKNTLFLLQISKYGVFTYRIVYRQIYVTNKKNSGYLRVIKHCRRSQIASEKNSNISSLIIIILFRVAQFQADGNLRTKDFFSWPCHTRMFASNDFLK